MDDKSMDPVVHFEIPGTDDPMSQHPSVVIAVKNLEESMLQPLPSMS